MINISNTSIVNIGYVYNLSQCYLQLLLVMLDNPMEVTIPYSPIGLEECVSLSKVKQVMFDYSLDTILIFHNQTKQCIGYIDNITVSKAISYGLGDQPVKEFMNSNIITATPTTSIEELFTIFTETQQPIIPIIENNIVATTIDKVRLLRLSQIDKSNLFEETSIDEHLCYLDMLTLLQSNLSTTLFKLLSEVGKLGDFLHVNVYVVGGVVRDILLNNLSIVEKTDIDIVVEGESLSFAEALAKKLKGVVRYTHNNLMTANVRYPFTSEKECSIDIATARLEYYAMPGALPLVEPTSIEQDLFRRDITINAMALQLNQKYFGRLIDRFHGQKAIQNKSIDVIHSLSFIEDPTRIIRAIRFEQRYQFRISQQTEKYMHYALKCNVIEKIFGQRLLHEFEMIFKENKPDACIIRMDELGVLTAIDKRFSLTSKQKTLFYNISNILQWYHSLNLTENQPDIMIIYLTAMCSSLSQEQIIALLQKIGVESAYQKKIALTLSMAQDMDSTLCCLLHEKKIEKEGPVSTIFTLLSKLTLEVLLFLQAFSYSSSVTYFISQYISLWRFIKPYITGNDLKKLGLVPGPQYKVILEDVLKQKLDGNVHTKEDELDYLCLRYNLS